MDRLGCGEESVLVRFTQKEESQEEFRNYTNTKKYIIAKFGMCMSRSCHVFLGNV